MSRNSGNAGAASQEREFAAHRQIAAKHKADRIGSLVRNQMQGHSGPAGEDRNHRDSNSFNHNGAYRDHRWQEGNSWGGADSGRRQQLHDEVWRADKKAERAMHAKELRKDGGPLHGPKNEGGAAAAADCRPLSVNCCVSPTG